MLHCSLYTVDVATRALYLRGRDPAPTPMFSVGAAHVARDAVVAQARVKNGHRLVVQLHIVAIEPAHAPLLARAELAHYQLRLVRADAVARANARAAARVEAQPEHRLEEPLRSAALLVEPKKGKLQQRTPRELQ
eukprot:1927611-Prymnesium_polylepis.1